MNPGDRVECYFNLHKNLYSVRVGGLVVAHTREIQLSSVTLAVQRAGRERVLREKRKNVHAFVRGVWDPTAECGEQEVTYNPYLHESFVLRETGDPVFGVDFLVGVMEVSRPRLFV
jgi:hypothetical protein